MLEIRNVTKIYKSKSGNSVKALDNVSITFPETGMVFILGKSGSGKSTLLNVIGGLDGYDGGEFIIKGKSSKDFAGSDFDAYRNTFIGFIFQEYNVLDDFTVGANIGLALELQGKKATNGKITDILAQVDMLDYAKRKPNELSGGQKQRVAIARALVKDPEIIMADEPTGALDSNTGKQIFDTLKELSRTKLVIIVSHDRDFAEKYGDRIIEMKDGRIADDVTKHEVAARSISSGILQMGDRLLRIEKGYQLTSRDVELINAYLREQDSDIIVSGDKRLNDGVRTAAGISQNNSSSVFERTNEERDVNVKQYSAGNTKFIRSRLPFKNAIKIGKSGLGHKKFRLVSTIALSLVAFTLFGFADTLSSYNKYRAATESIIDSNIQNATFSLEIKGKWVSKDRESTFYQSSALNENDIKLLSKKTGMEFVPVFTGSDMPQSGSLSVMSNMISTDDISTQSAYHGNLYGLAALDEGKLRDLGFNIVGKMPAADDEIAISEFMYRQFNYTGFENGAKSEKVKAGELTMTETGDKSIIGKHLNVRLYGMDNTFKITAVIDTGFDYNRYDKYVPKGDTVQQQDDGNAIVDMVMTNELNNSLRYGFHSLGYTTQDTIDEMSAMMRNYTFSTYIGMRMNYWNAMLYVDSEEYGGEMQISYLGQVGQSSDLASVGNITWIDGTPRTTLGDKEVLISASALNSLNREYNIGPKYVGVLKSNFPEYASEIENGTSAYDLIRRAAIDKYVSDNSAFAAIKDDLSQIYKREHGIKDDGQNIYVPSDDELKSFLRQMLNEGREHEIANIDIAAIRKAYFKKIAEETLGITFEDSLPVEFFERIFNSYLYEANEKTIISEYQMHELAIDMYVYGEIYGNSELYNSKEFFNTVINAPEFGKGIDETQWNNWDEESKKNHAVNAYRNYIQMTEINNIGDKSRTQLEKEGMELFNTVSAGSSNGMFDGMYLKIREWIDGNDVERKLNGYKIVGYFDGASSDLVISDSLYAEYEQYCWDKDYGMETMAEHEPGIYAFAIAPMAKDKATIEKLVDLTYEEGNDLKFVLQNQVMDTLYGFNDFIEVGAQVCMYVGIGFALFAALMLMNFISSSIAHKRREIGILRAVGARSSDVFKIFFSEAAIIAIINYVLSLAATIAATTVVNTVIRNEGINVTLLNFGVRQVVIMLLISAAVAFIASFLPVWNIARRKPVDAIKNK